VGLLYEILCIYIQPPDISHKRFNFVVGLYLWVFKLCVSVISFLM